jgi:hypothetical protein
VVDGVVEAATGVVGAVVGAGDQGAAVGGSEGHNGSVVIIVHESTYFATSFKFPPSHFATMKSRRKVAKDDDTLISMWWKYKTRLKIYMKRAIRCTQMKLAL